ncbi:MAG: NfeD family protein [Methanomassiliicoccales archaeon]|jgi:membrane protein implicated in regulation of membrane protease activity|nr:NfeD family protein [Methanomassiliicoccales archaeon]
MSLGTILALAFIVIGIIMLIAEAASPGSFILVPATVLIVLGGIGLVSPEWLLSWWAPVAAVIVLIPTTLVTIKLYQKLAPPAPPETTVATSLIGSTGIVVREVTPYDLRGKVRIQNDIWSATASKIIPVGARVVVKNSEGVHVFVEELANEKVSMNETKEKVN